MMKKVESAAWVCLMAMLVTIVALPGMAARQRITKNDAEILGAGATFPAPLYQRWISEFVHKEDGFSIFYDAVGSGEGIRRFMAEEIDFGASDAAMGDEQIMKMKQGVGALQAAITEEPDLIILDVMMSYVLDGLNLTRQMRDDPELKDISWYADGPEDARPLVLLHSVVAGRSRGLIEILEEQTAGIIAKQAAGGR